MIFACYGRKSVYSDKSDSVDNQLRMAREYAELHFPGQVDNFLHYSDEDFTGANTNRPDLQRLLSDVESGIINVLIFYQLDRLSRDIRDFSNIYDILEEHHVNFISLKENIDTTTPIGRAMMYVTVVFAQMERETIAARVRDNMLGLAKKGYWTGGNPPRGYIRERVVVDGKKHVIIVPDPEGISYVMNVVDTFLNNNFSLQSMETYYKNQGIKTENGCFFSTNQIHKILTMPYCAEATTDIYDYYAAKGCIMDSESPREKWDGSCGVMIYGRTTETNKKHQLQSPDKWLVCLGKHKPFMPAEKWLAVQSRLSRNVFEKKMKYPKPLLKGTLRCSCGSIMCVSRRKRVDGSVSSWYYCLKNMRQGKEYCDRSQIKIDILDQKVLDIFHEIQLDPVQIMKYAASSSPSNQKANSSLISKQITATENKIRKLAQNLSVSSSSVAAKYIIEEMERLDADLISLKQERLKASTSERQQMLELQSLEDKAVQITSFIKDFDNFTDLERNEIANKILTRCEWDGETLFITL